jgi:protein-tyrosine phosphatase
MIDIHCHILPGIDDGAQSLEDALDMARLAIEHGIHTIIATPHHANGVYENEADHIMKSVHLLNTALREHHLPLSIVPGQEYRVNRQLLEEYSV